MTSIEEARKAVADAETVLAKLDRAEGRRNFRPVVQGRRHRKGTPESVDHRVRRRYVPAAAARGTALRHEPNLKRRRCARPTTGRTLYVMNTTTKIKYRFEAADMKHGMTPGELSRFVAECQERNVPADTKVITRVNITGGIKWLEVEY